MKNVSIESHDSVAILRLTNGVTNSITPEMVVELSEALKQVKSEYKAIVLAGGSKFFCIGLNLPGLLQLGRPAMTEFWNAFDKICIDLYTLPIPTACAIGGHATAGGAILALACDYRFIASGRKFIGLNEVQIGVPVPYLADMILRQIVGDRAATEMTYRGDFLSPEEAQLVGLVDGIFSQEDIESRVIEKMSELAALPTQAFQVIKANRVEEIRSKFKQHSKAKTESFLDCWFSPTVQPLLNQAAEKF